MPVPKNSEKWYEKTIPRVVYFDLGQTDSAPLKKRFPPQVTGTNVL